MTALVGLEGRLYARSGRFILPLAALFAYLATFYAIVPVDLAGSTALSMAAVFLISFWLGAGFSQGEDPASAQLMCVSAGRPIRLYGAQAILMALLALAVALIAFVYPATACAIVGDHFFDIPPTASDALCALLIQFAGAVLGISVGALFHPRLIPDGKMRGALALFLALISLTSGFASQAWPLLRFPAALLPPLYPALAVLSGAQRLEPTAALRIFAGAGGYAIAAAAARTFLLIRKGF